MANFVTGIISLSIGTVVLATVFISTIKSTATNYSCDLVNASGTYPGLAECNWTAAEISLWGLLTLIGIAGMIYGVMNVFGMG